MRAVLNFLLRGNYNQIDKRRPGISFDQKIKQTQDSVTSLIYLGVILPILIWAMTGLFLLLGEVNTTKWIGASLFAMVSIPFYFLARRKVRLARITTEDKFYKLTESENGLYWALVLLFVFMFLLSLVGSIIIIRRMQFG